MYRDQLRPGTGMLFLFPEEGDYPFWMKNTLIPLDMIWIDSNRRIVHVAARRPAVSDRGLPELSAERESRYVLEVAGGVAKQHGLKAGDILRFEQTTKASWRAVIFLGDEIPGPTVARERAMFRSRGENLRSVFVLLFLNVAFFLLEHQDPAKYARLFRFDGNAVRARRGLAARHLPVHAGRQRLIQALRSSSRCSCST